MIVPVFTPPSRIDATNLVGFAQAVGEHVERHRRMVIDCSEVVWIAIAGMRVLEIASQDIPITLVNPNPAVHLMAVVFGGDVECCFDRVASPAVEPGVRPRCVLSVPAGVKLAS